MTAQIIGGSILIVLSLTSIWAIATRYPWSQKHLPFLCKWGKGGLHWPASKGGALLGAFFVLNIGLLAALESSYPALFKYLRYSGIGLVVAAIPMGIKDYRSHRKNTKTAAISAANAVKRPL
ncbi:MAG: hypothetical protein ABIS50_02185 [Luteolibacter sp.]|uniref:hypothetical protein n=1 Tax=Luteolibacter sp. TaxID=1962973 RepID=UPI003266D6C1